MSYRAGREQLEARIKSFLNLVYDMGRDRGMSEMLNEPPRELPHPCDGPLYEDWSRRDYLFKVLEEAVEAFAACRAYDRHPTRENRHKALWELTDLQVAAASMQAKLGADAAARQEYIKQVNRSNADRDGGRRFKE